MSKYFINAYHEIDETSNPQTIEELSKRGLLFNTSTDAMICLTKIKAAYLKDTQITGASLIDMGFIKGAEAYYNGNNQFSMSVTPASNLWVVEIHHREFEYKGLCETWGELLVAMDACKVRCE